MYASPQWCCAEDVMSGFQVAVQRSIIAPRPDRAGKPKTPFPSSRADTIASPPAAG